MKKTLIALAALAATGATLAQSSVTIYGRLDLGASSIETTTTDNGVVTGISEAHSLAGAQDDASRSRLGFRGTEDLGGGLRAGFVYEIGINADRTGVTNNARTRLANLSLSGGFGTVVIGTFSGPFNAVRGLVAEVRDTPGGDFLEEHQFFDERLENAIAYVTPAFSGFTATVGALNEDTSSLAAGVRTSSDVRGLVLGLDYSQGPLAVHLAFTEIDGVSRSTAVGGLNQDTDTSSWALGVRYTLAPVVLTFVYEDGERSARDFAVVGSRVEENRAWQIGASFPMGAFTPFVSFGDGERETLVGGVRTVSRDTRSWQIGTNYNLSRRTWVYAAAGEFRESGNAPGVARRDIESEGYSIGLVHTF